MAVTLATSTKTAVAQVIHDLVKVQTFWHAVVGTSSCSMVGGVGTGVLAVFRSANLSVLGSGFEGYLSFGMGGGTATPTASGTAAFIMFCTDDGSGTTPQDEIFRCTIGIGTGDVRINDTVTAGKTIRGHDNIFYLTAFP